jgi:hypothetical protein
VNCRVCLRASSLLFAVGSKIALSLNLPFASHEMESLRSTVNCFQLGKGRTGKSRVGQGSVASTGVGEMCHAISPRPHRPPRCPCHRISCASSTHFQCSTGLSFSCSTVSSCCSPARSAGPPTGIKKSYSGGPGAPQKTRSPLSFHGDLRQRLPFCSLCFSVCENVSLTR